MEIENWVDKIEELSSEFHQPSTPEQVVLGIHEAATNLWLGLNSKEVTRLRQNYAALMIGVLEAAKRLGVGDLDELLSREVNRLHRLRPRAK